ncbi:choice-of-anchor D domain-containing protein [Winogradskyella sp. DF17]|uniref:Choice-of-anchor D domain-containing protein n=1 Tax=Winogradskyella pelagia TaxID=2819984 RepID=A0ABS3T2N6_9FLAO|nr:LamG-like jellyroll fold domain-containing protein [Winogradskyella sp. DF17]MBO3115990.1 choice-of-anchor D domain-containing protein [Winogradskyella sp. DF17]
MKTITQISMVWMVFFAAILLSEQLHSQTTIAFYNFESGLQGWTDGGSDAGLIGSGWACTGTAIYSKDNDTSQNYMTSPTLDLTPYTEVEFSVCHKSTNVDSGEGFDLEFFDGTSWITVRSFTKPGDFNNNGSGSSNSFTVSLDTGSYAFAANSRFRLTGTASDNNEWNMFDNILIATPGYCLAASANDSFEWIGNVTLGSINNTSGAGSTFTGYSDFTAQSTDLTQGTSEPISITPTWQSTQYNEAYAVYIDYNQDLDFDDPGELVFTAGPDQVTPQTGNISVPLTATLGPTRMRVIMDDVNPVAGPCVNPNFGEVEDYTVNITAGSPLAEINITGNGNNIVNGDVTPSLTDGTDFGSVAITGGTNANSFVIENLGGVNDLNLTDPWPYVSISGTHAADFSLTAPGNVITAGTSTTFVITFDPSAIGLRTATVSIANDDTDENPYTFNIQGTGFVPPPCGSYSTYTADFEIGNDGWVLSGSDATRLNDGTRAYENNHSIRLRNTGAMTLTGLDFTGYEKVDFEFFFYSEGMELNESFLVEYRENSSASWQTVETYNSNGNAYSSNDGDFINNNFHARTAILTNTEFTIPAAATAEIRITNQGTDTTDIIYIDKVSIFGTTYCVPTLSPGGINSGLTLWLKADEITGSTVQADNSDVDAWIDNGQGHNARVSDPASAVIGKPVFKNNATDNVNFNPVIAFGNNPLTAPKSFTYLESGREVLHGTGGFNTQELYIVVVPDITVNSSLFPPMDLLCSQNEITNVWDEDVTGYGFGDYSARYDNEMVAFANGTNPTPTPVDVNLRGYGIAETGATVYDSNSVLVLSARNTVAGTSQELFMNGNNIGITEVGVPQFTNSTNRRFWLGRSQAFGGSFNGRIAEVISYNTRVDDVAERPKIESYLAVKYGITQGVNGVSQDYVDSDGTVIWDQSNNVGYNYDIAGIGRDDASTLEQKQSSSINYETDVDGRTRGILTMGLTDIYDTNYDNKTSNATTFNDKEFLMWGNDGADLNLAASTVTVNMSAGVSPPLTTDVTFTAMQRTWKVVESGGDIPEVKVRIPQDAIRNISPPGSYYMFISDTGVFDPTADYRVMTADGNGNLETVYDFDNTKYITFGYAPQVIVERSVYFDGAVDYVDMEDALDVDPTGFTLSAWIKRDAADSGTKSILSKRDAAFTEGYDLQIQNDNSIRVIWKNGSDQELISNTRIPNDQWHHVAVVYNGTIAYIYIDGVLDNDDAKTAPIATDESFYIAAAGKNTPLQHFRGNIDEVRVWDTALSEDQLRFVMNQEIADNAGQVMGNELPTSISRNDINAIPWNDLAGYYPMSVYTYTNTDDASGNGNQGALRNLDTVDRQTAPLPYESTQNGDWDTNGTWANGNVQYIPGSPSIVDPSITVDWNIVRTSHNVTMDNSSLPAAKLDNRKVLGLYVAANELTLTGNNVAHTGNGLTVSHYLRLTGKIDLEGESQLIQEINSDLVVDTNGVLEKDQQGTADTYTYNYWSAPVGETDMGTNNYRFTVQDVMFDGTNPINFSSSGYDGAASSPVTIADYWIWKFANLTSGNYSAWQHVRRTGNILAGEGFTMKGPGTGSILTDQNYVFLGKPNNGDVNLTINAGNDYLVGNPYASAIDANQFILDNGPELNYDGGPDTTPLLSGTLYFWEHWGGGSHLLAEYQGGYATYNFSGAVAAASYGTNDPDVGTGGTPTKLPGRYIPVGQGFFVSGETTGTINFNNGQRIFVREGSASSVFVRNSSQSTAENIENPYGEDDRMKFRIGFNSVNTIHRQLLLTIDEKATPGVDWAFDAALNETQMDDMFWLIDGNEFVIQGSDEPNRDTVFPLGVRIDTDGDNTIRIDELENVPSDIDIFLHDKALDLYHNLRTSDYTIFLNAGEYLERFEITFRNENISLGLEDEILKQLDILYSNDIEKLVLINPNNIEIAQIELFNILGQSILTIDNISEGGYSEYDVKNLSTGTYIVKLYTLSGSVSTKKVLVK